VEDLSNRLPPPWQSSPAPSPGATLPKRATAEHQGSSAEAGLAEEIPPGDSVDAAHDELLRPCGSRPDPWIGAAAADVAAHRAVDQRVVGVRVLSEERRGAHDLARLAETALRHAELDPRLLARWLPSCESPSIVVILRGRRHPRR